MRRILTIIALLALFPALAFAGKYYSGSSWVDTTRKYYNGSSWVDTVTKRWDGSQWVTLGGGGPTWTCDDADIFCEGFEGSTDCGNDTASSTNCNYSYVVSEPTDTVVNFSNSSDAGGQSGSYALLIDDNSSSVSGNSVRYTFGSNISAFYVQFYFKVVALTSSVGANLFIVSNTTSFNENTAEIRFDYVSPGNYKIVFVHRNSSNSSVVTDSDMQNLQLGTWYGVRMYYNANQSSSGVLCAVDYDLDGVFTSQTTSDTSTGSRSLRGIQLHNTSLTGSNTTNGEVVLDMIKINSSSFSGATVQ